MRVLPAVPSAVDSTISNGNSTGQLIDGNVILAHSSTTPTLSITLKYVCSKPTTASVAEEVVMFNTVHYSFPRLEGCTVTYCHCLRSELKPGYVLDPPF